MASTAEPDLDALAGAAGLHRRTVERHRRAGAPMPEDGEELGAWARRLHDWVAARRKRPPAAAAAKPKGSVDELERLRSANASIRELELAKLLGELLPRDEVAAEWRRRVLAVRSKLLALPRTIAGRCANSPAHVVDAEASAIIRDILEEFAAGGDLTPE